MRRTLPTTVGAVLVAGLLAAAVIAAPDADDRSSADKRGAPFGVLRDRPTELSPEFDEFEDPAPAKPAPPLEPVGDLPEQPPPGPSRALGQPWAGRLDNGVQLPAEGGAFFTVDSALKTSPSRVWRRWGTSWNVARTLAVVRAFHADGKNRPRLGIGDLSLPRGGPFGRKYGGLGHASHQNGLDVDIYYPRLDRAERPPDRPSEVDRRLSQSLVDRFVAAGASKVFVGPSLRLRGPRSVVSPLVHHDNHVHVRWPPR